MRRVLIANALLVRRWATWEEFRPLEDLGLDDVRADDGRELIYIGTQGTGRTYQTLAAAGRRTSSRSDLRGRTILTAGPGGMGGAQPLAATMAGAAILCIEVDPDRIRRRIETRYLDERADSLDDALARALRRRTGVRLLVALLANAADVVPELARRGESFDFVTDQTAAYDPLNGYIPSGLSGRGRLPANA